MDDAHIIYINYIQVRWERIAPGTNVTHSVVLRPRQFGSMTYTAAQVTYFPSEEANEVRVGFSNTPGEGNTNSISELYILCITFLQATFIA